MHSFLITYTLKGDSNYPELRGALKRLPHWHCLGSTWLVKSDRTACELFADLEQHLQPDDQLLVFRVGPDACWSRTFPRECQAWLEKNL